MEAHYRRDKEEPLEDLTTECGKKVKRSAKVRRIKVIVCSISASSRKRKPWNAILLCYGKTDREQTRSGGGSEKSNFVNAVI